MSARIAGVIVAVLAVVSNLGLSTLDAQVRQPQRLVHRPTQAVGYGFPKAGPTMSGPVRTSPAVGRVQQVGYHAGSYNWQENEAVQGEPAESLEALPQALLLDQSESVGDGYYESDLGTFEGYEVSDADFVYDDAYAYAGWGDCSSGACGGDDCDPCPECFWHGLGGLISNADFRTGVQGFKNTVNRQQDGSFGFHGGVNLGLPLKRLTCGLFSGSLGVNSVQSNFAGSSFTEENRNQLFVTAALFRRVDQGLQGGVAYDFLNEDWYTGFGISQLRSELSWVTECGNSFGFRYTKAQMSETSVGELAGGLTAGPILVTENFVAMRQYRTFYRKLVCDGEGYLEVSAGHTDEKHAILTMDFNAPLRNEALRVFGGFTYLLPQDKILASTGGQETWNVAMGIQFTPYKRRGYCRFNVPLFDVADNGTFQVRTQTP